jgi:4-hydroxy-2-oxoheptanedioate aldolase
MRPNKLRTIWADGGTSLNGWLHVPSSWSAEVMAHAGWDSLTIDLQHGFTGMDTLLPMLQAISTTETVPLVRATWNDALQIQRILDYGAYGVICPVVNTRAECEQFIGACRYPPMGYRSLGPTRARVYGGPDYARHANDTILTFAMVETATGLANLDEILSVPGLDGIFVGPGDLGLTLVGEFGIDVHHPVVADAIRTIAEKTRAVGKVPGIWCPSAEIGLEMQQLGYQLLTISSDARLLDAAAQDIISTMRQKGE